MNDADRIFGALVTLCRDIASANADADGHIERATISNRSEHMLGVDEGEFCRNFQICTGNRARTFSVHVGSCLRVVARKRAENEPFNIQNNVSDIFDDTLGSGEFVLNALDLDSGRFRAIQGREQNATHAIAQGVSIATLKRLNNEKKLLARILGKLFQLYGFIS